MRSIWLLCIKKQNIAAVVAGVVLIGYIGFLLGANYLSQMELQESAIERLRYDTEKYATAAAHFYAERKSDLMGLAGSREISIFFENKALGISMAYGLRASLISILKTFSHLSKERKVGGEAIYARIVFIDSTGKLLVDSQPQKVKKRHEQDWKKFLTPEGSDVAIFVEHDAESLTVIVTIPYFFKKKYAGQIIACVSPESVYDYLIKAGVSEKEYVYVDYGTGHLHSIAKLGSRALLSISHIPENMEIGEAYRFNAVRRDGIKVDMFALQSPVKDTPFFVVTTSPVSEVFGHTAPWHLLVAMGALALAVLGGTGLVLRVNMQNLILNTRLQEESKGRQEIEEKNRQLEKEIAVRKRVEEELQRAHDELEIRVEERTRELKETQKELINKAMEAGRAQLSAMVLHNIGNAITPIKVQIEGMKTDELEETAQYMEKCYLDLNEHIGDLKDYVNNDPRGKNVFSYMGELIGSLFKQKKEKESTVKKMDEAVSYISEILTLQQAYAAGEQETKERTDLNALIENAIRMQIGSLEKRQIIIKRELNPNISSLLIDKNRLMQVIVNFIKNSYEAIDEVSDNNTEKWIGFKSFSENGSVGFKITDSGIGIEPAYIDTIFEFGESHKGSSGFGLYYCKMFVEANKGILNMSSPGKGKGATVEVMFQNKEENHGRK